MGLAVISSNVSIKMSNAYTSLSNQSLGGGDTGLQTLITAPTNGYLKFRALPNGPTIVDPTVTFTSSSNGSARQTEMQIYVGGVLVHNQPPTSTVTVSYTLNLGSYSDFALHKGLSIQYRLQALGNGTLSNTITYPSGMLLVMGMENSP